MKRIVLSIALLLCLFVNNTQTYSISNITYTESNDIVEMEVHVKGLEDKGIAGQIGKFHVLSVDGEKVRLLADFVIASGYSYNASSDGDLPVSFENSMLYQGLMDNTSDWKSSIEAAGGKTNIYKVDAPVLEDFLDSGYFREVVNGTSYTYYRCNANVPEWFSSMYASEADDSIYWTRNITDDGNKVYVYSYGANEYFNAIVPYDAKAVGYGGYIRPVLETSIYNLIELNLEEEETDLTPSTDTSKTTPTQVVKVPATALNASLILICVGVGILAVSVITIIAITKNKKTKQE